MSSLGWCNCPGHFPLKNGRRPKTKTAKTARNAHEHGGLPTGRCSTTMPQDSSKQPLRAFRPDHVVDGAPFPRGHPSGFATEYQHLEPQFDPVLHLDLQAPAWIKPLISEYSRTHGDHPVAFPLPVSASASSTARSLDPGGGEVPFPGLAFTSSFRVLSDAGVKVLREIIARQEKYASGNDRQAKSMRGLGYVQCCVCTTFVQCQPATACTRSNKRRLFVARFSFPL